MELANRTFFDQAEELLADGCEVELRMKGRSMRPMLRDGRDIVILAPCKGYDFHKGDIVLFRQDGRHILHRVLRCDGDCLTLGGDGNYRFRERCARDMVAGRLVRVIRPSGRCISCDGKLWRLQSQAWLLLPPILRRIVLHFL